MNNNSHWDKEEFEELVTKGLIALYETKIKKHKNAQKSFRFTPELLNNIRKIGCYFSPEDRWIIAKFKDDSVILEETK